MKTAILLCLVFSVAAVVARPGDDHYTDRYDNINLDEILSNKRLLVPYVKCTLDQGKCTPDGKELKEHIIDALETECAKCTESQKKGSRRVIGHLINNEEEFWKKLTDKYDPDNKYRSKYEKDLRKIKAQ